MRIGDLQMWIMSIYLRPEATRVEFEYLLPQLQHIKDDPVFLCGDFNAPMLSFQTCGVDSWKTEAFMMLLPHC